MKSDPDALVTVIGETLARVKNAKPPPKRFRIHPLDVQVLEKHYPVSEQEGYTLSESIRKLTGVPVQWDCGVRRGTPVVDWDE